MENEVRVNTVPRHLRHQNYQSTRSALTASLSQLKLTDRFNRTFSGFGRAFGDVRLRLVFTGSNALASNLSSNVWRVKENERPKQKA